MIWITIFPGLNKAGLPYTFLLTVFLNSNIQKHYHEGHFRQLKRKVFKDPEGA